VILLDSPDAAPSRRPILPRRCRLSVRYPVGVLGLSPLGPTLIRQFHTLRPGRGAVSFSRSGPLPVRPTSAKTSYTQLA